MRDCVHVCGCSLVFDSGPISAVNLTSSLRGEDETLVISGGADTDGLVVDQPVL